MVKILLLAASIDLPMPLLMTLTGLLKISCQPSVLRISYLILWVILISTSSTLILINLQMSSLILWHLKNSLYPLISKPTRITSSTATLIDNTFTNNLELKMNANILYTDWSNHLPVFQVTPLKIIVEPQCQNTFVCLINSTQLCQKSGLNWKVLTGLQSIPSIL